MVRGARPRSFELDVITAQRILPSTGLIQTAMPSSVELFRAFYRPWVIRYPSEPKMSQPLHRATVAGIAPPGRSRPSHCVRTMAIIPRKLIRAFCLLPHIHRPREERILVERRLRGQTEHSKLQRAGCVVVSYGKSGRTWLRIMLSRFYQIQHGLSERHLMAFDNLHRMNPKIPIIFFTHDNYLQDFTGDAESKSYYYDKKVVLLARNPADVAVSQYFQWKFRMRPGKMTLNDYPEDGLEVSLFDFVTRPQSGIPKIIDFMNLWSAESEHIDDFLLARYEDMRADAEGQLAKVLHLFGAPVRSEYVREAVAFASVENMRKLEQRRLAWLDGIRMAPGNRANPDSYKVRRAKVGGYRDYFTAEQVAELEVLMRARLSPRFGYGGGDPAAGAGPAEG